MKKLLLLVLLSTGILLSRQAFAGTWQDRTSGLSDKEFYSIAESHDGAAVYVGTSLGLHKRGLNDKEWKQIFACRGQYKGVGYIWTGADNSIYIATKNGLFASRTGGGSWQRIFRGLANENYCIYVACQAEKGDTIYLGTLKGFFWTKDGGKTWMHPAGILGSARVNSIAVGEGANAEHIFIICDNEVYKSGRDFENYSKVFSADSLKSFQTGDEEDPDDAVDEELEVVFLLNHITSREDVLYLATNKGLFGSEDGGASWFPFSGAGLLNRWINYAAVSEEVGRIYAATKGGVFEYKKEAQSWSEMYAGMDSKDIRQVMLCRGGLNLPYTALWALCKRRVYVMGRENLPAMDEKSLNADRILKNFKNEPTINETMTMAIDYAEVCPEKIQQWRRQVKFKGLLPKVNLGIDRGWSDTYEIYTSSKDAYLFNGPQDRTEGWDINLSWDLSDLVWSNAQTTIDIRSKLMVQLRDDIVDEVNRAYFERRRLQIALLTDPPRALPEILKKRLRIQELTATLDGLTGSCFSKAIE